MLYKAARTEAVIERGGFVAKANLPGFTVPDHPDHGFAALAAVIESLLAPGTEIKLHEHVQDEIISWVPQGVMRHDDPVGGPLVIDPAHLMVMNAGRSFWHAERTLADDPPLRMLQIFVRPPEDDLEPQLQFGALPAPRTGEWRHVFGPQGSRAPFYVRNDVHFYDARLDRGDTIALPSQPGWATYFYVFSGIVEAEGQVFEEAESGLALDAAAIILRAWEPALVVAFAMNPRARIRRTGSAGDGESVRAAAARIMGERRARH